MEWGINPARRRKPIELPFVVVSGVVPGNHLLDERAHWRHPANTVDRLFATAMHNLPSGLRRGLFTKYFGKSRSNMD